MDSARLRDLLRPHILGLKDAGTHEMLPGICARLGLPPPGQEGSKRQRMTASFDALSDADLPRVAERLLELHPPALASARNRIQDELWADLGGPEVPKKSRREIARALDAANHLYLSRC